MSQSHQMKYWNFFGADGGVVYQRVMCRWTASIVKMMQKSVVNCSSDINAKEPT